jgi:guanosine-3',5'-bis(diphosphate) 3'-pyrophosphohydrolase
LKKNEAQAAEIRENAPSKPAGNVQKEVPVLTGTQLLIEAFAFAAHKHRDQRRKDAKASPYINHPIQLARVLAVEGNITDEQVIAAAILHDTIEDTETTAEEIRALFGITISGIVEEVSDDKSLTKADRKRLQIEHASHCSRRAKLVKLADKICNVRDMAVGAPAGWTLARQQEYFDWARQVVDGLRGVSPTLEAAFDAAHSKRPD